MEATRIVAKVWVLAFHVFLFVGEGGDVFFFSQDTVQQYLKAWV